MKMPSGTRTSPTEKMPGAQRSHMCPKKQPDKVRKENESDQVKWAVVLLAFCEKVVVSSQH